MQKTEAHVLKTKSKKRDTEADQSQSESIQWGNTVLIGLQEKLINYVATCFVQRNN